MSSEIITIFNTKGGVGKSTIARELGYKLNATVVDCDKGGAQELMSSIKVISIRGDAIPLPSQIEGKTVIYDFAGKFDADAKIKEIIALSHLVIVPYTPSVYSLQNTVESYEYVWSVNKSVMFVVNMLKDDKDIPRTKYDIEEYLNQNNPDIGDVLIKPLHFTRGLQSAENNGRSIYELRDQSPINKINYDKTCRALDEIASVAREILDHQRG